MDNARCVSRLQRVRYLHGVIQNIRNRHPGWPDELGERLPAHEFHHHELLAVVRHNVVDGDDVRMVQAGSGLRLLNEPPPALRIARIACCQHFNGDRAVQAGILGLVDIAHSTGAEFL